MKKNLIIVGMGPGMSMGLAQKFGKEGFTIGMISRSEDALKNYQATLNASGISAYYAKADVSDTQSLLKALELLKKEMGSVSVLNYNANDGRFIPLLEEHVEDLTKGFRISVGNALAATQYLLPDLQANHGAVLLTGGGTALHPMPEFATISLGKAGLRSLALMLHATLKKQQVYVGTLTINGAIDWDSPRYSPAHLAEKFWELYQQRGQAELVY